MPINSKVKTSFTLTGLPEVLTKKKKLGMFLIEMEVSKFRYFDGNRSAQSRPFRNFFTLKLGNIAKYREIPAQQKLIFFFLDKYLITFSIRYLSANLAFENS